MGQKLYKSRYFFDNRLGGILDNKEIGKKDVEKQDDDEISIDFSKIKNIFSSKKSDDNEDSSSEASENKESSEDDDISFNIDKIKGMFKYSKIKNIFASSSKDGTEKDDEDTVDLSKFTDVLIKRKKFIVILFLILIAFFTSVYLRSMPAYLPITDDWAENNINTEVRNQIRNQINNDFPNLPDANKNEIVEEEFRKYLSANKDQLSARKAEISNYYKTFLQDENGNTYLLAIDPYFWMRLSQNILDHGFPGDEKINGLQYDNYMIAPLGRGMPSDMFHAYFEAYLFKFVSFFNRDVKLMGVIFFVPILLSSLSVIPAFFIARRIGGNFGGFIAAFIIAIHPAFLTRTIGGFADTDAYNVLFPLFITWLFLEAFESKKIKNGLILSSIAGFLVGLYSTAWGGWWYIFDFLLGTSIIYLVYFFVIHLKELKTLKGMVQNKALKQVLTLMITFFISSMIFTVVFYNFTTFSTAPLQPFNFATIKDVATTTVWPNVFTTVAEQNEASYDSIINQMGGKLLFYLAILGIILSVFKKDIYGKRDIKLTILLIIWFTATVYASTKGVRWTLLLVPAVAVALGIFVGILFTYLVRWGKKDLSIKPWISGPVLVVLLLFLVGVTPIPPFCSTGICSAAINTARAEVPSMNDAWYSSLDRIKQNSEEDAIITSWWDFGHWFKFIADRSVTFDGTSQGTPMAHWVGKALLTGDEKVSIGILRMLDCGSNNAFDELDKVIKKPYRSIEIINEIIIEDKDKAKEILIDNYGLTNEESENVLVNSHCDPPEAYLITSDDMIGKSGVWGHFGSWDFRRATIFNRVISMGNSEAVAYLGDEFNITGSDAQSLVSEVKSLGIGRAANDWIAPWPSYSTGFNGCTNLDNYTVQCSVLSTNVRINTKNITVEVDVPDGIKNLDSIIIGYDSKTEYREFDDNVGVGMVLIPDGDNYLGVVATKKQVNSMFTKLFYLDGAGLKHFKKFSDDRSIFGNHIKVWKIDWDGIEDVEPADVMEDVDTEIVEEEESIEEEEIVEEEVVEEESMEEENITEVIENE